MSSALCPLHDDKRVLLHFKFTHFKTVVIIFDDRQTTENYLSHTPQSMTSLSFSGISGMKAFFPTQQLQVNNLIIHQVDNLVFNTLFQQVNNLAFNQS